MEKSEIQKLSKIFNEIYFNAKLDTFENDWMRAINQNITALKYYHKME